MPNFFTKLLTRHSSVLVLVALMAYYSVVTLTEQHPVTPAAARQVARAVAQLGPDANALIVTGSSRQDELFAEALRAELESAGGRVVGVVRGKPTDARQQLESLGRQQVPVDVIATHHAPSQWRPLLPEGQGQLARQYPSLANMRVYKPASYTWPSFLTRENLLNVVNQNAPIAIIAIGMTMVIITGGIDLSVGSLLALAGVVVAVTVQVGGGAGAIVVGCLAGLAVCGACGAFTGAMVTAFRVPAFVVTLSMMMVARGLALITAVGYHSAMAGGAKGTPEAVRIDVPGFGWLGNGQVAGVPNPVLLMLLMYLVAHVVMTRTVFGRYIYAVGGNPEAARLSGVPVVRILVLVYVLSALMAGLAGIVDASRFVGGRPNAGELYELQVIAAVVVGGASLRGGEGRIFGTLVGALIIAVIQNGLNMAGVTSYEQMVVFGGLILAASLLDQLKHRTWRWPRRSRAGAASAD